MRLSENARAALGAEISRTEALAGGDLSCVFLLTLANNTQVIAKRAPGARTEAAMLRAIRGSGCPAPAVIHCEDDLILMEPLRDDGAPSDHHWAEAGAAIARLHACEGALYGWEADHAFGPVAIPGGFGKRWDEFWVSHRLLAWPEHLPGDIESRVEHLASQIAERVPPSPPPSLLHGDLWSGNLVFGAQGFSGLIDPACSYGDAEVDLAMLRLFGTPPPAFDEAYGARRPGWRDRRPIYQLWPALVHLRLFGASYRGLVERLLSEAGV